MHAAIRIITLGLFLLSVPTASYAGLFDSQSDDLRAKLLIKNLKIDNYEPSLTALNEFYAIRDYKPAWSFQGKDNLLAMASFLDSLEQQITYHGLSQNKYPLQIIKDQIQIADSEATTKVEILVTSALLQLIADLNGQAVDLSHLYPGWSHKKEKLDSAAALAEAIQKNTLPDFLNKLAPSRKEYSDLAQILSDLRAQNTKDEWPKIDKGTSLRPNDRNDRVFQLRQRLEAEGYIAPLPAPATDANYFDKELETALKTFQTRHGLDTDGHVGEKTRAALNTSLDYRIMQVRANMERWRHIPDDFPPSDHAIINIPAMTIDITKSNGRNYSGPVIVGRVDRKTPFIASQIHHMIVNPSWHVPSKIAKQDILPKLRKDPRYLEKLGFVIKGNEDDPHGENIDWQKVSDRAFQYQLRQAPGEQNSLGRLKFDFENDFAVYMHGTPHQELFAKSERALSSGCVRLRDPTEVAEVIFSDNKTTYTAEQINGLIGAEKTKWLNLNTNLPIYFLYWTVFRDKDGNIQYRKDIYDYDRFLIDAIN